MADETSTPSMADSAENSPTSSIRRSTRERKPASVRSATPGSNATPTITPSTGLPTSAPARKVSATKTAASKGTAETKPTLTPPSQTKGPGRGWRKGLSVIPAKHQRTSPVQTASSSASSMASSGPTKGTANAASKTPAETPSRPPTRSRAQSEVALAPKSKTKPVPKTKAPSAAPKKNTKPESTPQPKSVPAKGTAKAISGSQPKSASAKQPAKLKTTNQPQSTSAKPPAKGKGATNSTSMIHPPQLNYASSRDARAASRASSVLPVENKNVTPKKDDEASVQLAPQLTDAPSDVPRFGGKDQAKVEEQARPQFGGKEQAMVEQQTRPQFGGKERSKVEEQARIRKEQAEAEEQARRQALEREAEERVRALLRDPSASTKKRLRSDEVRLDVALASGMVTSAGPYGHFIIRPPPPAPQTPPKARRSSQGAASQPASDSPPHKHMRTLSFSSSRQISAAPGPRARDPMEGIEPSQRPADFQSAYPPARVPMGPPTLPRGLQNVPGPPKNRNTQPSVPGSMGPPPVPNGQRIPPERQRPLIIRSVPLSDEERARANISRTALDPRQAAPRPHLDYAYLHRSRPVRPPGGAGLEGSQFLLRGRLDQGIGASTRQDGGGRPLVPVVETKKGAAINMLESMITTDKDKDHNPVALAINTLQNYQETSNQPSNPQTLSLRQVSVEPLSHLALGHLQRTKSEIDPEIFSEIRVSRKIENTDSRSCTFCTFPSHFGVSDDRVWLPVEASPGFCDSCKQESSSFDEEWDAVVGVFEENPENLPEQRSIHDVLKKSALTTAEIENDYRGESEALTGRKVFGNAAERAALAEGEFPAGVKAIKSKSDGKDITKFMGVQFCRGSSWRQIDCRTARICEPCRREKMNIMKHRHGEFKGIAETGTPVDVWGEPDREDVRNRRCMICPRGATDKCVGCPLRLCAECCILLRNYCKGHLNNLFYFYGLAHLRNDAFLLRSDGGGF